MTTVLDPVTTYGLTAVHSSCNNCPNAVIMPFSHTSWCRMIASATLSACSLGATVPMPAPSPDLEGEEAAVELEAQPGLAQVLFCCAEVVE
ncbi:hypothetical protein CNMCM6457_002613 [Aspergillus fumigatiaffinis]|nr:hypothetical protein CNMCM6457_002613 [Aspergillus fumigatiaffinis]